MGGWDGGKGCLRVMRGVEERKVKVEGGFVVEVTYFVNAIEAFGDAVECRLSAKNNLCPLRLEPSGVSQKLKRVPKPLLFGEDDCFRVKRFALPLWFVRDERFCLVVWYLGSPSVFLPSAFVVAEEERDHARAEVGFGRCFVLA